MTKYEFKKFPLIATIVTIVGLILAVISVTSSLLNNQYDSTMALALLEVIAIVLFLAGLTTGKVILLRVISIISTVVVIIVSFALCIENGTSRDVVLFGLSLFMLIASVLGLVYFLTVKNPRSEKLFLITSIVMTTLIIAYGIIFIVNNVTLSNSGEVPLLPERYLLIFAFAFIAIIPAIIHQSLSKIETVDEPVEVVEEPLTEEAKEEQEQKEN